jgi:anti-sigma factor RsiW
MKSDQELKLQAFFDGELPEAEAREAASWVARDSEAAALLTELRNTRKALAGGEPVVKLPESREFYWSKIQREIQRQETPRAPARKISLFETLRNVLIPLGSVALLLIIGIIVLRTPHTPETGPEPEVTAELPQTETELADASAVTYSDQSQGMTVVWLSYPAEKELADTHAADTIQQ